MKKIFQFESEVEKIFNDIVELYHVKSKNNVNIHNLRGEFLKKGYVFGGNTYSYDSKDLDTLLRDGDIIKYGIYGQYTNPNDYSLYFGNGLLGIDYEYLSNLVNNIDDYGWILKEIITSKGNYTDFNEEAFKGLKIRENDKISLAFLPKFDVLLNEVNIPNSICYVVGECESVDDDCNGIYPVNGKIILYFTYPYDWKGEDESKEYALYFIERDKLVKGNKVFLANNPLSNKDEYYTDTAISPFDAHLAAFSN